MPLMTRDMISGPGKDVMMIVVTYLAGGASLPHRHHSEVFVYLPEGGVTMKLHARAAVTLRPGQAFYESPSNIHQVSANASQTAPLWCSWCSTK